MFLRSGRNKRLKINDFQVFERNTSTSVHPDISYYLIFAFLHVKDLHNLISCCRHFHSIISSQAFHPFYKSPQTFIYNQTKKIISQASLSPLCHFVNCLEFRYDHYYDDYETEFIPPSLFNKLSNFSHLHKLDCYFQFATKKIAFFNRYKYCLVFQSLAKTLKTLELRILASSNKFNHQTLFSSICFLTSLTSLSLELSWYSSLLFQSIDFSFIGNLKKLEFLKVHSRNLTWSISQRQTLINQIRNLQKLTKLEVSELFKGDSILSTLRQLCVQPGAPPKLNILNIFSNISSNEIPEYIHLLKQMTNFEFISLLVTSPHDFPLLLVPFIHSLDIKDQTFNRQIVQQILSIKSLTILKIFDCTIDNNLIHELIEGIGHQLKVLDLNSRYRSEPKVSFALLSNCVNLENLFLTNIPSLVGDPDQIEMLRKCSKLQTLVIIRCNNLSISDFSPSIQKALTFPFSFIPSLTNVEIIA
jgi:hypothetical protein